MVRAEGDEDGRMRENERDDDSVIVMSGRRRRRRRRGGSARQRRRNRRRRCPKAIHENQKHSLTPHTRT